MKRTLTTLLGGVLAVVTLGSVAAAPLKVKTQGTKSQTSFMCPDCKSKVTCAQAGDFIIGLVVDQDNPKLGTGNLVVHVQDKAKKPVDNAKVSVALSMPKHGHGRKPIVLKSRGHGEYAAQVQGLNMSGAWQAVVEVNAAGDVVRQTFSFAK